MAEQRRGPGRPRTRTAEEAQPPAADPRQARTAAEREIAREEVARTPAEQREAQRIRVEQSGERPVAYDDMGTHPFYPRGEKAAKGKAYVVLHGAVGPYRRGSVVHEGMFPEGADFRRLLRLEAIRPASDEEAATLWDEFDPAPLPTLQEAIYSDSPPTLPHVQGIATSDEEVRAFMSGQGGLGPKPETPEQAQRMSDEAQEHVGE